MNESVYEKITALQSEIAKKRKEIEALREQAELEPVNDYTFKDWDGNEVTLSSLFGSSDELMVIHNMGKRCVYCTLWADGLNGFAGHLNSRAPFVVVSPDAPEVQQEFAESRGWQFKMVSGKESPFTHDMGFEPEPGTYWPGVSTFVKKDGKIYRKAHDIFGPGDSYCSVWHLFDLLPNKIKWEPKYSYNS